MNSWEVVNLAANMMWCWNNYLCIWMNVSGIFPKGLCYRHKLSSCVSTHTHLHIHTLIRLCVYVYRNMLVYNVFLGQMPTHLLRNAVVSLYWCILRPFARWSVWFSVSGHVTHAYIHHVFICNIWQKYSSIWEVSSHQTHQWISSSVHILISMYTPTHVNRLVFINVCLCLCVFIYI